MKIINDRLNVFHHDESSKDIPKPDLQQHKIMVTVWSSDIVAIHSSFMESN